MIEKAIQEIQDWMAHLDQMVAEGAAASWLLGTLADYAVEAIILFLLVAFSTMRRFGRHGLFLNQLRKVRTVDIARFPARKHCRVRGHVSCANPMRAPISGRPCVFFRLSGTGKTGRFYSEFEESQTFEVRDSTGVAEVRSVTAKFAPHDARAETATSEHLIAQHAQGKRLVDLLNPEEIRGKFQILEEVIAVGDEVTVSGVGAWRIGPDGREKLTLEYESPREPLRVSNDSRTPSALLRHLIESLMAFWKPDHGARASGSGR